MRSGTRGKDRGGPWVVQRDVETGGEVYYPSVILSQTAGEVRFTPPETSVYWVDQRSRL